MPEVKSDSPPLTELQSSFVSFFTDAVKVAGLPPSTGQIYGLLFSSKQALSLDQLVDQLEMSKGSASQGLRLLRQLGAVKEVPAEEGRRTFYHAEDHLRRLVGGFIREQIRPHMESGMGKADALVSAAKIDATYDDNFYEERALKIRQWLRRGKRLLPFIQKVLGE